MGKLRTALKACLLTLALGTASYALTVSGVKVPETSVGCVECHLKKNVAPKVIDQWAKSKHAKLGVGCAVCHRASPSDGDAFQCPGGPIVASHPTPKDCAICHPKEVKENTESKHVYPFWLYANADRAVFEPTIATKAGCEECHNIGALHWDGSAGECDACHPKHTFDIAVARNPYTCGECHVGPDHPHIEIYLESKHGNIFMTHGSKWDLSYRSSQAGIPIDAPVCTTCHMDAAPGVEGTHNVSARLAWEMQAPWSYRTQWFEEKLGDWKTKRKRMEAVCKNCHAPEFIMDYFLQADLVNLQYNELRRQFVKWAKLAEKYKIKMPKKFDAIANPLKAKTIDGKVKKFSNPVINAGWVPTPAKAMYYSWHHEGRRFRHGAMMMGADYTQWHGIWELQYNLIETIHFLAEHGVPEAKKIWESKSPTKFYTYRMYDFPGNVWSIVTAEMYKTPAEYKLIPNYWKMVKKNVETAYKKGWLTKEQWDRWLYRYNHLDKYLGTKFGPHPIFEAYKKRKKAELNAKDPKSGLYKAIHLLDGAGTPTGFEADPNNK